jgi:RHS repeat-associated protein
MPGRQFTSSTPYKYGFNGKENDNEVKGTGNSLDFDARILDSRLGRWLAIDKRTNETPSKTPYGFATNCPIVYIDEDGDKEKPYVQGTSKPIEKIKGTETIAFTRDAKGMVTGYHFSAAMAYNCHSYAWHNSNGDPTDPANKSIIAGSPLVTKVPKWDQTPEDDIESTKSTQLGTNENNKVGDIVVYYQDANSNGQYDKGEGIAHSAIVDQVDKDGNTEVVKGKMGEDAISLNHPGAPGYYEKDGGKTLKRAYFRKPSVTSTTTSSESTKTGAAKTGTAKTGTAKTTGTTTSKSTTKTKSTTTTTTK